MQQGLESKIMGFAISLRANNDNCSHERLKRALEVLEQAVETNRLACLEFKETISDLKRSVEKLDGSSKAYQKTLGQIGRDVNRTNRMSKDLLKIMDRVTE
ncbi:MAG: hypothetical protein DHS20C02_04010 [Micavibrio sp.]|nr:MAG: hypothetical protein DHS20C02_04010 [Micavibrio sp.]